MNNEREVEALALAGRSNQDQEDSRQPTELPTARDIGILVQEHYLKFLRV